MLYRLLSITLITCSLLATGFAYAQSPTLTINTSTNFGYVTAKVGLASADITCGVENPIGSDHTRMQRDDCAHSYATGERVTLSAIANPLYEFRAWQGNCSSDTATITITMNQNRTCTPSFARSNSTAYTRIAIGADHRCAIQQSGRLQCWGSNASGQFGIGTITTGGETPVTTRNISTAIAVSAGVNYTCAVLSGGTAWCWGLNTNGVLGTGSTALRFFPTPQQVKDITTAITIVSGRASSCALLANGTAQCWGRNGDGQLGNGTRTNTATPVAINGISTAITISYGTDQGAVLLQNKDVFAWGVNRSGQLAITQSPELPTTPTRAITPMQGIIGGTSPVSTIAIGGQHSCATLDDGAVRCWGNNRYGQLGTGVSEGRAFYPVSARGISTAIDIAVGSNHSCALLNDGTIRCWGRNDEGQLGIGSTNTSIVPIPVPGISAAVAIAANTIGSVGEERSCAILTSSETLCWGAGNISAVRAIRLHLKLFLEGPLQ